MRAVVQRVTRARVSIEGEIVGQIEHGLCVFVGVMNGDGKLDAKTLARKVRNLRVFSDKSGRMNLSVSEVEGRVLAVSQFTLAGDVRKGNRPAFTAAMGPEHARELFERFCSYLREESLEVETGRFQEEMSVSIENDGPVTILLDTGRAF